MSLIQSVCDELDSSEGAISTKNKHFMKEGNHVNTMIANRVGLATL